MGKNVEKEREKQEKKEQKEREKREKQEKERGKKRIKGWDTLLKKFKILTKDCQTFPDLISKFDAATTEAGRTAITKKFNELLKVALDYDKKQVIDRAEKEYNKCVESSDYCKTAKKNLSTLVRQYIAFERKIGNTDADAKEIVTSTKEFVQGKLQLVDKMLSG